MPENKDYSYLAPADLTPEVQQMSTKIQQQSLPKLQQLQGVGNTNPIPSINELIGMNSDSRVKAVDNTTPFLDVYKPLNNGEYVSMYESYIPRTDNMERLAQQQSTGKKWANGLQKFGAKTFNAIIGGTAGVVYGLGAALSEGSVSAIYDNDFSNKLNDLDTKLNYQLPNYYTKQEQNKGILGQTTTANFWADKFLGGLSFTAGAIISEAIWAYATGGTSLATMGVRGLSKWGVKEAGEQAVLQGVSKYGNILKGLEGSGEVLQAGAVSKTGSNVLGKAADVVSITGKLARSAGYEASVEALQYKKEAENNFYANFEVLNGRQPNAQEIADFEVNNTNAANAVFGANMAILMPSNLVMLGHTFGIKNPINLGIGEFIEKKAFGYGIEKGTGELLKASTKQNIARNVFDYVVKPSLTEGIFEEGGQGVVQKTANKWIEHTYNPKHTTETLSTMDAFTASLAEQYGTEQGWKDDIFLGMLIGIAGGSVNVRGEQKSKEEELKYQVSVAKTYDEKTLQSLLIPHRIQTANRIAGFSEEAKQEEAKGNITKSEVAKKSAILSFVNAKLVLGNSISDITNEMKSSLDVLTPGQWKEAGIEADQIQQEKEDRINEFNKLAKQFKANKTYWNYVIGEKLVGAQALTSSLEEGLQSQFSKTAQIVEALAWQSTIGESANQMMSDTQNKIGTELGYEYQTILSTISKVKGQEKNKTRKLKSLQATHQASLQERDNLVRQIAKLNNAPKETEGNSTEKIAFRDAELRLLEVENTISQTELEAQALADEINASEAYKSQLDTIDLSVNIGGDIVLGSDLLTLNDSIKKFEGALDFQQTANPQRAKYIKDLLQEYSDAEEIFRESQATQKVLSSPDFKMENIGGWVSGKLKNKKAMNENTQEWLQNSIKTYTRFKTNELSTGLENLNESSVTDEEYQNFTDNGVVSEERLNEIAGKIKNNQKLTKEEQAIFNDKTSEINDILKQLNTQTQPKSKEVKSQPTFTDSLEGYKAKVENLLKDVYRSLHYLPQNADQLLAEKPTQEDFDKYRQLREDKKTNTKEYRDLRQKLSDWKLLSTATDDNLTSIADLLDLIQQLETEIEEENTKDEVTEEEAFEEVAQEEKVEGTGKVDNKSLLVNVQAPATAKFTNKETVELTHIKPKYIVDTIGQPYIITRGKKVIDNVNIDKLKPEDVVAIDGMTFKVLPGGRIELNVKDFDLSRQQQLNLHVKNTKTTNWSFVDLYSFRGEEMIKTPSQFEEIALDSQKAYETQKGDRLTLHVEDTDNFNKSKAGDNWQNFKIVLKDKNGNNIQTLKSGYANTESEVDDNFLNLRMQAYKNWEVQDKSDKANLGISVEVENIFLGSPQLRFEEGQLADGEISKEATEKVIIAKGFIQDGQITLDNEIKDVNTTYVSRLSKNNKGMKVPMIVLRKGVHNIAFPITMVKSNNPVAFDELLEGQPQEMVMKVNQAIIDNRIKTPKLTFEDISIDIGGNVILSDRAEKTKEVFANKKSFVTSEQIANKKYSKTNLMRDALIRIDLDDLDNVFNSAKIRVDIAGAEIKTTKELQYASMNEIEDKLNDLAVELYNDFTRNASTKYVNSRGEIVEDTKYSDTFDDSEIVQTTSQIQKIANINILREAMSEKLHRVVENAIGVDKIKEVKKLLNAYDSIKAQIIVNNVDFELGEKNIC